MITSDQGPFAGQFRSSDEWSKLFRDRVIDDDGWRAHSPLGPRDWDTPITLSEYDERFYASTVYLRPELYRLYFPSFAASNKIHALASHFLRGPDYRSLEIRTWLSGQIISTPHADVAALYRNLASKEGLTFLEGREIPEDPQAKVRDTFAL